MVKYKNSLIKFQILSIFLIPLVPHFKITDNFQSDDIPIVLFLLFFFLNLYSKNFQIRNFKDSIPLILFIFYISLQNLLINNELIFSDNLRFTFYLILLFTVTNIKNLDFLKNYFFFLMYLLSIFSILFYFFELNLGIDSYKYWKIGFNENEWVFTSGRMNGFQAGGPNAFGALLACLTIYCVSSSENIKKYTFIFLGILGCFFTYSRASIFLLIFLLIFFLTVKKDITGIFILIITLLVTVNFGLVERFTSEAETQGIEDRIQMQEATISDISNKSFNDNLIGYGFNNFGIVRDELKSIDDFSKELRPTGPHNSFLFILLNYGLIGLCLFLYLFLNPLKIFFQNFKTNILKPNYLFLGCFTVLSFTGDLIQNHSISVLFFLLLFESLENEYYE